MKVSSKIVVGFLILMLLAVVVLANHLSVDLTIAVDHLQAQTEIAYEAVKGSVKDQVARAADAGQKAERVSWLAGLFSLLLGAIVAALIVRSINDPLRRLTRGTRAIAK